MYRCFLYIKNEDIVSMKTSHTITSDYTLWQDLKHGDKKALEKIYKSNYTMLFNYGWRIVPDEDLIRESIQELFLYMVSHLKTLGATDNIRSYLMASLRRRLYNHIKKSIKMAVNEPGASFQNDLKRSNDLEKIGNEMSEERKAALDRNIKQLSKREQEAIYLRFYKEMSYREIAGIMNIHNESVRKLLYRAIKSLRVMSHVRV